MTRTLVKYPVNHHLSQLLERLVLTAAVRRGPLLAEVSLFNGDEPTGAGTPPNADRFGDSWSARLTLLPLPGVELSGSHARVTSPEFRRGAGLDQRKRNLAARWEGASPAGGWSVRSALVEWARTEDLEGEVVAFRYSSTLAELVSSTPVVAVAVRLERTTRPEEERLLDAFRSPRPPPDFHILGLTRWDVATVQVAREWAPWRHLLLTPFVEGSLLSAKQVLRPSLFVPRDFYGRSRLTSISAGVRVDLGHRHARMGRYGVADPSAGGGRAASGHARH
jgi:hypothetical protein